MMAMTYLRSLAFCVICCSAVPALSQITLPGAFIRLLHDTGLELLLPIDAGYKLVDLEVSDFQPCQLTIYSRQEKIEIRYLVEPYDSNKTAFQLPHVNASRWLMHLASNDEDATITGLSLDAETLSHTGADWGKAFFFKPKSAFSSRQHCQLTVLHKHLQGAIYIFLLFDNPNNPNIPLRESAVFFKNN